MTRPAPRADFGRIADDLEARLRAVGAWQATAVPPDVIASAGPFGLNAMSFTQWLQFVLVPRLRDVASGASDPPTHSEVAAQAVREFDGWPEGAPLVQLLAELDDLVIHGR